LPELAAIGKRKGPSRTEHGPAVPSAVQVKSVREDKQWKKESGAQRRFDSLCADLQLWFPFAFRISECQTLNILEGETAAAPGFALWQQIGHELDAGR
jgi:hypothetical protein